MLLMSEIQEAKWGMNMSSFQIPPAHTSHLGCCTVLSPLPTGLDLCFLNPLRHLIHKHPDLIDK